MPVMYATLHNVLFLILDIKKAGYGWHSEINQCQNKEGLVPQPALVNMIAHHKVLG